MEACATLATELGKAAQTPETAHELLLEMRTSPREQQRSTLPVGNPPWPPSCEAGVPQGRPPSPRPTSPLAPRPLAPPTHKHKQCGSEQLAQMRRGLRGELGKFGGYMPAHPLCHPFILPACHKGNTPSHPQPLAPSPPPRKNQQWGPERLAQVRKGLCGSPAVCRHNDLW